LTETQSQTWHSLGNGMYRHRPKQKYIHNIHPGRLVKRYIQLGHSVQKVNNCRRDSQRWNQAQWIPFLHQNFHL